MHAIIGVWRVRKSINKSKSRAKKKPSAGQAGYISIEWNIMRKNTLSLWDCED